MGIKISSELDDFTLFSIIFRILSSANRINFSIQKTETVTPKLCERVVVIFDEFLSSKFHVIRVKILEGKINLVLQTQCSVVFLNGVIATNRLLIVTSRWQ